MKGGCRRPLQRVHCNGVATNGCAQHLRLSCDCCTALWSANQPCKFCRMPNSVSSRASASLGNLSFHETRNSKRSLKLDKCLSFFHLSALETVDVPLPTLGIHNTQSIILVHVLSIPQDHELLVASATATKRIFKIA
jgi:hypothetical protein